MASASDRYENLLAFRKSFQRLSADRLGRAVWPVRGERGPVSDKNSGNTRVHMLRSGMAAGSVIASDGRGQRTGLFAPGDSIIAQGSSDVHSWIEALGASETFDIVLPDPQRLPASEHMAANAILLDLSVRKLRRSKMHAMTLGRMDSGERLCAFLADIVRRTGRERNGAWVATLHMSRDDIADYLGLNAETVSRGLTRIKHDGLARFPAPKEVEIPDLGKIEAMTPFLPSACQKHAP